MKRTLLLLALLLAVLAPAGASTLYSVTVDTTGLSSATLGFQFAGFADPASVRIFNFVGGTTSTIPPIPSAVTENGPGDYGLDKNNNGEELLVSVSGLSGLLRFYLQFTGSLVPEPVFGDFNTFAFAIYGTLPDPPDGFGPNPVLTIDFSDPVSVFQDDLVSVSEIPEPSTFALGFAGMAALLAVRRVRR